MYPHLFGVPLWWVMTIVGVLTALLLFRFLSSVYKLDNKSFLTHGGLILVSIVAGFGFAYLFQFIYDLFDRQNPLLWRLDGSWIPSATAMGGVLGAAIVFFVLALIFLKGKQKRAVWATVCIGAVAIPAAHAFGRIGCFLNGCCFGISKTEGDFLCFNFFDGWTGGEFGPVYSLATQLIEAAVLLLIVAASLILILKLKKYSLPPLIYLFSYSIFRFVIEFFRADQRGGSASALLTPSQWQSILMFLGGVALLVYMLCLRKIPFNQKQIAGKKGMQIFGFLPQLDLPFDNGKKKEVENDKQNRPILKKENENISECSLDLFLDRINNKGEDEYKEEDKNEDEDKDKVKTKDKTKAKNKSRGNKK